MAPQVPGQGQEAWAGAEARAAQAPLLPLALLAKPEARAAHVPHTSAANCGQFAVL